MMGLPDLFIVAEYVLIFCVGSLPFIWAIYLTFGWMYSIFNQ